MDTSAMIQPPPHLYWEARAYCDEHELGPESLERVRMMLLEREYRAAIEPLTKLLVRLENLRMPRMQVQQHPDGSFGSLERWGGLSPELTEQERWCYQEIDAIRERYGLDAVGVKDEADVR